MGNINYSSLIILPPEVDVTKVVGLINNEMGADSAVAGWIDTDDGEIIPEQEPFSTTIDNSGYDKHILQQDPVIYNNELSSSQENEITDMPRVVQSVNLTEQLEEELSKLITAQLRQSMQNRNIALMKQSELEEVKLAGMTNKEIKELSQVLEKKYPFAGIEIDKNSVSFHKEYSVLIRVDIKEFKKEHQLEHLSDRVAEIKDFIKHHQYKAAFDSFIDEAKTGLTHLTSHSLKANLPNNKQKSGPDLGV